MREKELQPPPLRLTQSYPFLVETAYKFSRHAFYFCVPQNFGVVSIWNSSIRSQFCNHFAASLFLQGEFLFLLHPSSLDTSVISCRISSHWKIKKTAKHSWLRSLSESRLILFHKYRGRQAFLSADYFEFVQHASLYIIALTVISRFCCPIR